jgi:hypothetical protein
MTTKRILVTGDYLIDIHLLKGSKKDASGNNNLGTILASQYGGSVMTFSFMEHFKDYFNEKNQKKDEEVKKEGKEPKNVKLELFNGLKLVDLNLTGQSDHHSYLQWEYSEKENTKSDKTDNDSVDYIYRITDKMGFGKSVESHDKWLTKNNGPEANDIVVIDEAAIGFRDCPAVWPDISGETIVIFKTTQPIGEGAFWKHLCETSKENLITIVKLDQLRHSDVKISKGISWEQTALDLSYEIIHNRQLSSLLVSDFLIVTIGSAGALIIKNGNNPEKAEFTLVFDPENMEDEWEYRNAPKIINSVGLGSAFLAGFSSCCANSVALGRMDINKSVRFGLHSVRSIMKEGFILKQRENRIIYRNLSIPDLNSTQKERYSEAFVPSPYWKKDISYLRNNDWSILENNYDSIRPDFIPKLKSPYFSLARDLAFGGAKEILYAPLIRFENIVSFDRQEIESLRNIRKQVDFYAKHDKGSHPLNIAVFGPPGSGKSYMVKSMANSLFQNTNTQHVFFTFNLSQFKRPEELSGAFHAIRDAVLKGKLPFVFWDEFDSDDLNWLKHMIGPMQDGEFQEGKDVHPVGKSIFLFAGGTSYSMKYFGESINEQEKMAKKVPDFLSRINCYLNVLGPNRKPNYNESTHSWEPNGDPTDLCYPIRRAMFIRTNLKLQDDEKLKMDWNLLSAFLEISKFINGARSLDRLLTQLSINKNIHIERSDLPSDEIINMNVDYDEFMKLIYQTGADKEQLYEKLARNIHDLWMENDVKHSIYNVRFAELTYDGRLDNYAAAKRMEEIIKSTGKYQIVTKTAGMPEEKEGNDFNKYILDLDKCDMLAEKEHDMWYQTREVSGWKYAAQRSNYHKLHDCMVKFNELDKGIKNRKKQKEKQKDRNTIENYTKILKGSGYTITQKST